VGGVVVGDDEVAGSDGSDDEEGAGFNAIREDAVGGAVEAGDSADADGGGAGSVDARSHGVRSWARSTT